MKAMMKRFFSFSISESEQFDDKQGVVELVNCPLKEMMCKVHLTEVYKSYLESERYRGEKNYNDSIKSLKVAFNKTNELMEHPCTKCAQNFRQSIVKAMLHIHDELDEMSKGFFGDKNYLPSYLKSVEVLTEFKNAKQMNSDQLTETNERFLGNFLN